MAKTRMVNTRFWSDNFISELNPLDRYLFLYLLTNEHTNISGIYELPLKAMSFETGIEIDMLKKMIRRLYGKVFYIEGWVCIKNFQKHQSTTSTTVKRGIEVEMAKIPLKIKEMIDKVYPIDTLSGGIIYLNFNSNLNSNLNSEAETSQVEESNSIVSIIEAFKEVNPAYRKWFANKTQRAAAERLIKSHTLEQALKVIAILPRSNKLSYVPTITTPLQLEDKWASLEASLTKKKAESIKNQPKVIW